MKFLKSKTFMIILVAIVLAAAVGFSLYGIFNHSEAGFMAKTPEWRKSDFPLSLCVTAHNGAVTNFDSEAVDHVVRLINSRLDFTVFQRVTEREACEVSLTMGVPTEAGWQDPGGAAVIGLHSCHVVTANVSGELTGLVVYHELGHCLGLDHDDSELSIMRRVQRETPNGVMPPWFSDFDRKLLRDTYAPE
jgi:hypothetical protein